MNIAEKKHGFNKGTLGKSYAETEYALSAKGIDYTRYDKHLLNPTFWKVCEQEEK